MNIRPLIVLALAGLAPHGRDFGPVHTDGSRPSPPRLDAHDAARRRGAQAKRDRKNARRLVGTAR